MPTSPPTLRALLICVPSPEINGYHVVQQLSKVLRTMFHTAVDLTTRYHARECTREHLTQTIEDWIADARRGVPHLFFFAGHGGRVHYRDLEPEIGEHALCCLATARGELLGCELSAWLGELDRRCGNVAAIIDSCHSAAVVRAGVISRAVAPDYVREALAAPDALAAESHPRIVRLASSSPVRESFAEKLRIDGQPAGGIGYFTTALLEVLEDAADRWSQLSWEMLAHAVRERVIWELHEHQWLSLAGPGGRLLFDHRPASSPRLVGCMAYRGNYWIRAGALTGVQKGDLWGVVGPFVDGDPVAIGPACEIQSNRAALDVPIALTNGALAPVAAVLQRVREPMPVAVDPGLGLALTLEDSTWLTTAGTADQRVRLDDDGNLEIVDERGEWETLTLSREIDRAVLFDILEDRARARRIMSLKDCAAESPTPSPIRLTVGAVDAEGADLSINEPLAPDSALWVRLTNTEDPTPANVTWFASVILIDVIGCPLLLNASLLDGVELEAGGSECVGKRLGGVRSGVVLCWPPEIPEPRRVRTMELVLISSRRPLQLGHLTRALPLSEDAAFRMQGLEVIEDDPYRSGPRRKPDTKMAASEAWGWQSISLSLAP